MTALGKPAGHNHAKDWENAAMDAGLYCATRPSVERCSSIRVSCWMGAYAGLGKHFQQCNLDPRANLYDQVLSPGA